MKFVESALENNFRHAGIIIILPEYDNEEAEAYAELLAKFVAVYIEDEGKLAWRRRIIYVLMMGLLLITTQAKNTPIHGRI